MHVVSADVNDLDIVMETEWDIFNSSSFRAIFEYIHFDETNKSRKQIVSMVKYDNATCFSSYFLVVCMINECPTSMTIER
jgi:hypothetical protein